MKNKQKFLLIFIGVVLTLFIYPGSVDAASNKVLLVYDYENTAKGDYAKIDSIQRVLTSLNLRVKTVSQENYYKGMLNQNYLGVVTLINWPQVGLTNQTFIRDRQRFKGIKLHIGDNLTDSEAAALGGKRQKIYQQQLLLKDQGNQQLLPFSETMTVLSQLKKTTQEFGVLASQQKFERRYSYGVINNQNGYLPYFETSGLSFMTAVSTMAHLFDRNGNYRPLLTITGVSPYSDLKFLDQVSKYCYQQNIPFAVSTVTVSANTEMAAYHRFTTVLKKIEDRNGIIFLQTPQVGGATSASAQELNERMTASIVAFANHQIYPVGISSAGYWNQDRVLRQEALVKANHWLFLPSKTTTFVKQDNNAQIARQSFFAVTANSLGTIKQKDDLKFAISTAITIPVPTSTAKMTDFKRQIQAFHIQWYNPVDQSLETKINTGSTVVAYKAGNYFLNGQRKTITAKISSVNENLQKTKTQPLFSRFFHLQGNILMLFFAFVLIVLLIFISFGRRIYWRMFKR